MSTHVAGRHRAPESSSAAAALTAALGRGAKPAAKASAVVAVAGGLVASFAMPLSASASSSTHSPARSASATAADAIITADAVALAAPSTADVSVLTPTFGQIGVTGVVKPKPKPKPKARPKPVVRVVQRATVGVSRSVRSRPTVWHPTVTHRSSTVTHRSSTSSHTTRTVSPTPVHTSGVSHGGVLGVAARYAGTPYVYGGSSPSGFDCSGFTSYVFRQVGIYLPRTAAQQQAAATRVSSPQPGDLVFFGYPAGHVGIYAGGGMMWDSPHTGSSVGLHTIYSGSVSYGRP